MTRSWRLAFLLVILVVLILSYCQFAPANVH